MKKNIVANLKDIDLVNIKYNGVESEMTIGDFKTNLSITPNIHYIKYTALLTQSGTNPPTSIILENTLGEVPTYSYDAIGSYYLDLVGNLFTGSLFIKLTFNNSNVGYQIGVNATNQLYIETYIEPELTTGANGLLSSTLIEIVIYN